GAAGKIYPTSWPLAPGSSPRAGCAQLISTVATTAATSPEPNAAPVQRQSLIVLSMASGRPKSGPLRVTRTARKVLCKHILQNVGGGGNESSRHRYTAPRPRDQCVPLRSGGSGCLKRGSP